MQAPQLVAQLLNLRLGHVLLVLRPSELFTNIFQIAQYSIQRFADAFHFSLGLLDQ